MANRQPILKRSNMKKSFMVILAAFLLSGCAASVAPSFQMSRETKIYIFDVSGDDLIGSSVVHKAIGKRIVGNTAERLEKDHIMVTTDLAGDAANLKYDIRALSGIQPAGFGLPGRDKIEIKYRVTLKDISGKKLFVFDDTQSDDIIDDVCDKIAGKVSGMVLRYYVDRH
jgi:hypothetical protein